MADGAGGPFLIAGAGIGGLTAAIALAREGFEIVLIERATRFAETGAGVQLSPNASRVLIDLGLGPAVGRVATSPEALVIRRLDSGRELARMPVAPMREMFGAPYWAALRADLQTALIDAARSDRRISFRVGRTVTGVSAVGSGVEALVENSTGAAETVAARALVGADGLWSRAAASLGPDRPPIFAGYEAWRALVPAEAAPSPAREPVTQLWIGADAHLVCYPVAGGRQVNLVLVQPVRATRGAQNEDAWNESGDRDALRDLAAHMAAPARDLVRAAADWRVWPLYDRHALRRWTRGPIALLGDAAHPVLPFLAQGAGLAIEDAAVLAQEAARHRDDLARAFARYASRRMARAARAQAAARSNARIYHARGPVAWARDLTMRSIGGAGLLARHRWIYGWTPNA